jgi:histidinol dehydrogenase
VKILLSQNATKEGILKKLRRGGYQHVDVEKAVRKILAEVKQRGDHALFDLTKRFDGVSLTSLSVGGQEIREAYEVVDRKLVSALRGAERNIRKFHRRHVKKREQPIETAKGVRVWREFRPIERVGFYVPGGKAAYPSTVLMLAVPARIAGCREVIMCTPAREDGGCHPAVLVAADLCGVEKIFKVSGAQAIAAMAYGTETVPHVDKIFGPGNAYVTTAKMLVYGLVDIDMPAGPSEVLVIADESANPDWIAADLLAQLEHGEDSQAVLMTPSRRLAEGVAKAVRTQIKKSPRQEILRESSKNCVALVVGSVDEACMMANAYAPEHLEIMARNDVGILNRISNAGSVFLGKNTPEPLGDYATGANHTLPTSGFSRMFSPLSTESFGKMMQVQRVSREGIRNLRKTVETLAESEGLDAHRAAVSIRFE